MGGEVKENHYDKWWGGWRLVVRIVTRMIKVGIMVKKMVMLLLMATTKTTATRMG
jgi:hypothetical protein